MSRTDGSGATPRQEFPDAPSAVDRLEDMKEHRTSLMEDIRRHWTGWLGSLTFHVSLLVLFMAIVSPIVREQPDNEMVLTPLTEPSALLATEPLESLIPAPYQSRFDVPNIVDDRPCPSPDLTELTPGIDIIGREGPYGKGLNGPGGDGIGEGGFFGYLEDLNRRGLDVVFVFDSTGSMGGILLEVKTRIRTLTRAMNYFVPGRAQLGMVTYRDLAKYDLDDYEYTVRFQSMVKCNRDGLDKLNGFLRRIEAYGGGDVPEAVYEGVETAITRMKWREDSVKVIIVFGDAPPRPENDGLDRILKLCQRWHEKTGGIVTCIDTSGDHALREEFKAIAAAGGGVAESLGGESEIVEKLVLSMFDPEYTESIRKKWKKVTSGRDDEVIEEE